MAEQYDVGSSSDGFLKVRADDGASLSSQDRAALIRKGNELFNTGHLPAAKRIFMTVRYADGLIRLGNRYIENGDSLEALRMFWLAGDRRRIEELSEQMAGVIRKWLREDQR
ncbi:MAG: hypothetical protein ACOCYB_07160 [Alkalispirochaeta sp.]